VTNILGHLRKRGRLRVPVVATITDFGVHRLWAHPAVDLHLVMHETAIRYVERFCGPGSARAVDALVAPAFRAAPEQGAARAALDLPMDAPVVLVSGGGWGVGEVARAVEAALSIPGAHVLALSGRSESLRARLERRFDGAKRLRVVPFTDRMTEILAAADVLVDSSLGVTSLEALTIGRPIVAFGAPPGHSRENRRALGALGLAETPRSKGQLASTIAQLVAGTRAPQGLPPTGTSAAAAILSARARALPRGRHHPALVAGAGALATFVFAGWAFASPTSYPILERTFGLATVQRVSTTQPEVGLLLRAQPKEIPALARTLARQGVHGSFVVSAPPGAAVTRAVAAAQDSLIATAPPTSLGKALRFRTQLVDVARPLRPRGRFYYLPPASGFNLADYVAVRAAGGYPVNPSVRIAGDERGRVEPGMIVLVDLDAPYGRRSLTAALTLLSSTRLRGLSLDVLLGSSTTRSRGEEPASQSAPPPTAASATTSPPILQGDDGHHSRATSGASATGTNVVSAKMIGATWETRRCRSADISLSVPAPAATFITANQKTTASHVWVT